MAVKFLQRYYVMKRILLFLCVVSLSLSIISCTNQTTPQPDNDDTDTTVESTSEKDYFENYVPSDDEDNTMLVYPKDPAKYVVDYMTKMATVEWTPQSTFHLYGKYQAWKYDLVYEVGKTYYGLPFLVGSRGTLQQFNANVNNKTYIGGTTLANCIGDACYDAVYVALIQVCPSITFESTEDMLPKNNTGLMAVGDWDTEITKTDTPTIIQLTDKEVMAQAYAQLLPGDVILKHVVYQDAGHARIVNSKPTVVYNDDNTINLAESYITTLEQTNLWDKESDVKTSWWVNHKYTFEKLLSTNFVPLRPIDYTKDFSSSYIATKDLPKTNELKGTVFSNQYIFNIEIIVTNELGESVYTENIYPNAKTYNLEDADFNASELDNGKYTMTIKSSLSFGTKQIANYNFEN